jgi:hypothetical protein
MDIGESFAVFADFLDRVTVAVLRNMSFSIFCTRNLARLFLRWPTALSLWFLARRKLRSATLWNQEPEGVANIYLFSNERSDHFGPIRMLYATDRGHFVEQLKG